ncbi:MAG: SufS family cysteine desulfurase [Rikenellaceae bacterium]
MLNIEKIRKDFPILDSKVYGKDFVYLDSAATSQKPQVVIDKVNYLHQSMNANIHRGVHFMSSQLTTEYENARETVRAFIGAESTKEIVFTSGATQSINLVAATWGEQNIEEGDIVIVSEMEHHSNIVPWQILCNKKDAELKVIPFNNEGELDITAYADLLSNKNVKLVAVTGASNVLGTMPDIARITAMAHSVGAKVLIDGCQYIVHSLVDVKDIDCDFFAFSGHKLYAPTGIGVLYAKEELLEEMPPYMGGGDMVAHVSFEKTTYAELPLKFEAGTSNYIGAIGLGEAINYLQELKGESTGRIELYERELLEYATAQLSKIEELRIYGTTTNKAPIVSFNIEGVHALDLGMILDKQGIAVRTGTHCAEPIMTHFGVMGMVRASFGIYNTKADVDALCAGIERAIEMLK